MNKRGREENFAFGTTDQSNSHRKPLLMRAVQEKKGGRQGESEGEEKKGMARHSYTENKEMNHIQRLVEDMGACECVCVLGWWWGGCLKGVFKIVLTSSLRERQRQGQVN